MKGRGTSAFARGRIYELADKGLTLEQISTRTDTPKETVRKLLTQRQRLETLTKALEVDGVKA